MRHRIAEKFIQFQSHINISSILFSVCEDPDEFFFGSSLPASLSQVDKPERDIIISGTVEYECTDGFLYYDADVSKS